MPTTRVGDLEVRIGADLKAFEAGMAKVGNRLGGLKKDVDKAARGTQKFADASRRAGTASINLNRIVEDSRYGFIGVQNNIEPMLTSFRSLKATTKTTSGAFAALGKSLLGPVGLLVGFNLVLAAGTLLPPLLAKLKSDAGDAKKAFEGLGKAASGILKKQDLPQLQADEEGLRKTLTELNRGIAAFETVANDSGEAVGQSAAAVQEYKIRVDLARQEVLKWNAAGVVTIDMLKDLVTVTEDHIDRTRLATVAAGIFSRNLKEVEKSASGAKTKLDELAVPLNVLGEAGELPGFLGGVGTAEELGMKGTMGANDPEGVLRTLGPLKAGAKQIREDFAALNMIAFNVADGIASAAGSIVDAATMTHSWGDALVSLGQIARQVFRQMIVDLIKIAILQTVMNAILPGSGSAAGVIAGIGGAQGGGLPLGASPSFSGASAGQAAFSPAVLSLKVDGRDFVAMVRRTEHDIGNVTTFKPLNR